MATIAEVEQQVAREIRKPLRDLGLLPDGFRCSVRLHGTERDKRRNADFEKNWSPETDSIRIAFEPDASENLIDIKKDPFPEASKPGGSGTWLPELIRALDRAESRPGYEFISLKWFRDTALVGEGFAWTADQAVRHGALREAIERRLVLTHKVPNPRSPLFPVTAIRLNRLTPEVKAVLGGEHREEALNFRPVHIRGEPLSATVLRDRR